MSIVQCHRYYSDQFDGPVKVQQREEQQAKNRARQSRGSDTEKNASDSEEVDDGEEDKNLITVFQRRKVLNPMSIWWRILEKQ
ncbi:hypothetical protein TNCT_384471 [Trichonephila clavata]|uniref:Uncharacterized protein n=1 Tax=Trichonephila clavata TaxID=2740835 RepID=A0A8X6FR85_TRICU|nr:hypothetical protein TNCT_384471 [Trichonephila clavata]